MTRPTIQDEYRYARALAAQANPRTQNAPYQTNRE
jgi:hypothetical protein